MSEIHDIEVDLILVGARGKRLLIMRTDDQFAAVVLDRTECARLISGKPQFTARRITNVVLLARSAVEGEREETRA